ncbi:MAG: iron ABC transporter permease [Bacteroidaceae bacterium]|nr:iron ABC transporter permease [Bacteroidaceae bacterium]
MSRISYIILIAIIVLLFLFNLLFGSVHIPISDVWKILTCHHCEKESWTYIILESRIPQAFTALFCGASLATSGLILQTVFANPLAGPSILGISSGANLGVAIVLLATGGSLTAGTLAISGTISIILSAFIGSLMVMGIILMFSSFIHNNLILLIIGIMIGYVTSSVISLLNFFSTAEGVHSYVIWGMGNFGGVSLRQLPFFASVCILGLVMALLLIKPLNALLLGHQYAESLGINIRKVRNLLLIATGILTAVTTAFCGPIAFIGLAVPHIARAITHSDNHHSLLPTTILTGAAIALLCNLLCILPGSSGIIPLNAITPLLGAPVIIYVIIRNR